MIYINDSAKVASHSNDIYQNPAISLQFIWNS